jgi:hypothetical protein
MSANMNSCESRAFESSVSNFLKTSATRARSFFITWCSASATLPVQSVGSGGSGGGGRTTRGPRFDLCGGGRGGGGGGGSSL